MANTYTQIHFQVVFAVQNRQSLISKKWEDELYKYITGIIQNYNHKVLQINGMPNHIHILFGMRPTQSLSDLMKKIKGNSSKWINEKEFLREKFSWQAGYGGFTYSKSQLPNVIRYIKNQKEHHKNISFLEEYLKFLKDYEVEYDERYLLKDIK